MTQLHQDKVERFIRHLEPLQSALSAFCRRALSDQGELPDALQSAVANAFRDFDLYAEGTNFRAWIFRYVSFEVLNRNRAQSRSREVELPHELADPRGTSAATSDADAMDWHFETPERILDQCDETLVAAVHELPELDRNILLLRAIGDFKYREIAEILEVPIGTVMGLLSRSRERLRQRLLEYATEQGLLSVRKEP